LFVCLFVCKRCIETISCFVKDRSAMRLGVMFSMRYPALLCKTEASTTSKTESDIYFVVKPVNSRVHSE